ncbi:MAG TPA: cupin domain-containing protein [Thermoleophilaceae bacterium]
MQRVEVGQGDRRRPPVANGPIAELLLGADGDTRFGVAHIVVPPGAGMPAHDHGVSETLLVGLSGRARLAEAESGGATVELQAGAIATIPVGRRVTLENAADDEAHLLAIFSPADFAARIADWPADVDQRPLTRTT